MVVCCREHVCIQGEAFVSLRFASKLVQSARQRVDVATSEVMPAIELLRVAGFERISTPEGEVLQRLGTVRRS